MTIYISELQNIAAVSWATLTQAAHRKPLDASESTCKKQLTTKREAASREHHTLRPVTKEETERTSKKDGRAPTTSEHKMHSKRLRLSRQLAGETILRVTDRICRSSSHR